ncbi:hypothetical protein DPMN_160775 [Dreissena polymorpha]|uniref:Uncharacterized protein n=1 Tax=Dreissena polymorpha TaxID=45954 RepID=A0A9D4IQG3_DREPO|nr:hypothetical protein DPMN_160775 [Dreissena polymorpha]
MVTTIDTVAMSGHTVHQLLWSRPSTPWQCQVTQFISYSGHDHRHRGKVRSHTSSVTLVTTIDHVAMSGHTVHQLLWSRPLP